MFNWIKNLFVGENKPVQPPKVIIDVDNLTQEHKDIIFNFTHSLASDGVVSKEDQELIIQKAGEVGIPSDKILKAIAVSWNGRPDVGEGVTEDVIFKHFKDVDPALLGRVVVEAPKIEIKSETVVSSLDLNKDGKVDVKDLKVAASKAKASAVKAKAKVKEKIKK